MSSHGNRLGRGRGGALGRVVRAGVGRRRIQTLVIALSTMIAVTATVLAGALLMASRAPFDHAFNAQNGAHLAVLADGSKATSAQLAASAHAQGVEGVGVTAASGPYPQIIAEHGTDSGGDFPGIGLPPMNIVGRANPGGPVDDLVLTDGRWIARPGEIVVSTSVFGARGSVGMTMTFPDLPGKPVLTVVGIAQSITGTADAWVEPSQIPALTQPGTVPGLQMLYRFANAATDAQVTADRNAVAAALPRGAVTGSLSWLSAKLNAEQGTAPFVPFIVAFGVLGLVMSVIIIVNVVSGAVGASLRRIGILKALGFTPSQVVRAYIAQALIPSVVGIGLGVLLGNVLAAPLLAKAERAYGTVSLSVATWIDIAAPCVAIVLVAVTAFAPALRAGRLRAVEAIAVGRSPKAGRGRVARRLLGRAPLPRAVSLGLGSPFARPARTLAVAGAVVFGAIALTFAAGLVTSFRMVQTGLNRDGTADVSVDLGATAGGEAVHAGPKGADQPAADPVAVAAAIAAQPGTGSYFGTGGTQLAVSGISGSTLVTVLQGSAAAYSVPLISGSWFTGPGQAVVPTRFLQSTGTSIGSTITLTDNGTRIPVRIVGEVFDLRGQNGEVITDARTLSAIDHVDRVGGFEIHLSTGVNHQSYIRALNSKLHPLYADAQDTAVDSEGSTLPIFESMIAILTAMLATVAGLAVLNAAVLETRERVHDLGVYKAVGMSPRQTIAMVLSSTALVGLVAGFVGVPVGIALHGYVVPIMAHTAGTNLPQQYISVYSRGETVLLGLGGLVIAIAGALLPAGWAAKTRTAAALRTE
ncbi:MAG TPA: FtsX-like permease family protein [Actinocrinis sp.]|uniref:ABC transporter permease n=1 Tax=Actinocrinis sp. TaxID=1920516 RepID=UPI002D2B77AE|nr:FtsX-like permease family protein [Actinocrinis sp.]HZU57413.1 FtsX-like permease family protein [Actinocrinis sp.]